MTNRLIMQGVNEQVDAGTEDIWDGGGTYTGQPTGSAEAINIVSSSAADAAAGTGLRTLRVEGLDASGAYVEETFTLNGTTPVVSSSTWTRVFRAFGLTAGTGGTNAGAITIKHNVTTANVFAVVQAGRAQAMIAAFTVPTGRTATITSWGGQVYGLSATAAGEGTLRLKIRPSGSSAWRVVRELNLPAVPTTKVRDVFDGTGLKVAAGTDVKAEFISVTAATKVLADLNVSW